MLPVLLVLLFLPAAAFAFSAPSLSSPANGTSSTEGKSVAFDWSGALQGAVTSRSFFRVEIAGKNNNPDGQQAVWSKLANFSITDAGANSTNLVMGVPSAGDYEWRVCAWGVADANVNPEVQQLTCSNARTLSSQAAAHSTHSSAVVTSTTTHTVTTATRHQTQVRITPAPATPAPKVTRIAVKHKDSHGVARFENPSIVTPTYGENGSSSTVSLSNEGLNAGSNASGAGAFGFLNAGLGATIPGLPLPFWSLAIFLLVVPMTSLWRRSLLAMFEWPEEREARRRGLSVDADAEGDKPAQA